MSSSPGIAVLGGGPAGVVTAIKLIELGYRVTLFQKPRRFTAMEAVSGRVVKLMQQIGLTEALETLAPASPRFVIWQGHPSAVSHEQLIYRPGFDIALQRDAQCAGVEVHQAQVLSWKTTEDNRVHIDVCRDGRAETIEADFVVEARGRSAPQAAAPSSHRRRVRGIETISLLQYWRPSPSAQPHLPCSAIQSFPDGWAWLAHAADGRRYIQLTFDAASINLPPRSSLIAFCREQVQRIKAAESFIANAEPDDVPHARASTPILSSGLVDQHSIRVGDAAIAADPVSGSGIFLAISEALQTPAVIHTLLQHPERAALAQSFHEQRLTNLFYRFARVGRDFYAAEPQWDERPFWIARRSFPDDRPVHQMATPDSIRIERRPVINNNIIIEREVVVTPDQPLGVWLYESTELAPALKLVRSATSETQAWQKLRDNLGEQRALQLLDWMKRQGWF